MERIKEIEAEMARTQKNKATNYHLGTLKAKLAKLRSELFLEQSGGGGGGAGEGFDVARNGDARVALIGFPSVGKSRYVPIKRGRLRSACIHLTPDCPSRRFLLLLNTCTPNATATQSLEHSHYNRITGGRI